MSIITNMGAANPQAAAEKVVNLAGEFGMSGVTVAAVIGDDVLDWVKTREGVIPETGEPLSDYKGGRRAGGRRGRSVLDQRSRRGRGSDQGGQGSGGDSLDNDPPPVSISPTGHDEFVKGGGNGSGVS